MTIGPITGTSTAPEASVATVPGAVVAPAGGGVRLAALLPAITRMGTAIEAALVLVDAAQLDTLLGLLGNRGEYPTPAPAALARFAPAPMPFAPVPVPAPSTAPRPSSVSGRGLVGDPVEPGSTLVPRIALERDHGGPDVKAFAVAGPGHRFRIVLLGSDWAVGLPAGRRGATVVAEALRDALGEAFRGEPPLRVDVEARTGGLLAITWRGGSGVRVAPILDNIGFALLARPGGPTPEEIDAARGEATRQDGAPRTYEHNDAPPAATGPARPDRSTVAGPDAAPDFSSVIARPLPSASLSPPGLPPTESPLPSVAAFIHQAATAGSVAGAAHRGGGGPVHPPGPAMAVVVLVGLLLVGSLVGLLALGPLGPDSIGAGLLLGAVAVGGLAAVGLVVGAVSRNRSEECFERER